MLFRSWRDCPTVFLRDDGVTLKAGDCHDSTDIAWTGTASTVYDGDRLSFSFSDFGATGESLDGWSVDGQMSVTQTAGGYGYNIDGNLDLTSIRGDESTLFWVHTEGAYGTYNGAWYADQYTGDLGIEAWGTSTVRSTNVPLAAPYGCSWGAHPAGEVLFGDQAGLRYDADGVTAVSLGMKGTDTGGADSGGSETGDTETGDSAAPKDSDSGDSAAPVDDGGDYDVPTFGSGVGCGSCIEGAIGDKWLDGCIEPSNPFDWPFPSPF